MKIDGINPAGGGGEVPKKRTEKAGEKSFDSFLKESVSATSGKSDTNAPTAPVGVRPTTLEPTGKAVTAQAIKRVEAVLDDLDFYRNVLANSDVPLSRLLPMADTLTEKRMNWWLFCRMSMNQR